MPLFLSEEEFGRISGDPALVAEKADEVIIDLRRQLDTIRAEADAASIAADQTYNILEQRYTSLSSELSRAQSEASRLSGSAEQRLSEIAEAQAAKHELHLKLIEKDGEIERVKVEASELHKSKRQLLELVSEKDAEIAEKNGVIQSYLNKIIKLTEDASAKEGRLQESESELIRCRASSARLLQEKEMVEKHNKWLNEELENKLNSIVELRRTFAESELEMTSKLTDMEKKLNQSSKSLKQKEETLKEYAAKLDSLQEELTVCKTSAVTKEQSFLSELSTVTKLADLYKESSEEWCNKSGELAGVIKALETHLNQVENDYKGKLEKESALRESFQKEAMEVKDKLKACETELEKARKSNEQELFLGFPSNGGASPMKLLGNGIAADDQTENTEIIVAKRPANISGTALAASLLRDGWSLAKMYEKYQEAADALRHERWERKHSEAILEKVLSEIEEKAGMILEERAEHERMAEAYASLNQKLQQASFGRDSLEATIRNLKADVKQKERNLSIAEKEISDLQGQVTVLLKECSDIQVRCGITGQVVPMDVISSNHASDEGIDAEPMTIKDIKELVKQCSELRIQVQRLSSAEETYIAELKEKFQTELQKHNDDASSKVEAVLRRCEEQARMLESLHTSVAMYKRLYEEEQKNRASGSLAESVPDDGNKDLLFLYESSQVASKKTYEELVKRTRGLEADVSDLRNKLMAMQSERDKYSLEAKFAKDKLDNFMLEYERHKTEANAVSARNVELTQLIVDYQRRLRENAESLYASDEYKKKLSLEVAILKSEKEVLLNSEKRAMDEIRSLSDRAHRLQSSLDTTQSVQEVHEEAKLLERRKLEEHVKVIEREWAEAKKELQEERDRVRGLTAEREKFLEDSMRQVDEMRKELSDAWRAVSAAESRAAVAEDRCSNLETMLAKYDRVGDTVGFVASNSISEATGDIAKAQEEIKKLKEEAKASRDNMVQYKEIAIANEVALKKMESAHEEFKNEAAKLKMALESEILVLKEKVSQLEKEYVLKSEEAVSAISSKDTAISFANEEVDRLRAENSMKMAKLVELEAQICSLKENLDREHERWRTAQDNYERQVILQSEAIKELNQTSQVVSSMQNDLSALRKHCDILEAESEGLKLSGQNEKKSLMEAREEAEKKYKELDAHNAALHKQLEDIHMKYININQNQSAASVELGADIDNSMQAVINHLRRSKEIAEVEVSLLRQEKLRLQAQLETASKSLERTEQLLQSQREKTRAKLYTEEEYKSLKQQVTEVALLRESNVQLREENKHNFEERQKYHSMVQNLKMENETLTRELSDTISSLRKQNEILDQEKRQLDVKLSEMLEKSSNTVDLTEFEMLKEMLQQAELNLKEKEAEVVQSRTLIAKNQESIISLEEKLANYQKDIDEKQKRISDLLMVEADLQSDVRRHKKRAERLVKEKEDISKENQSLKKQYEYSHPGRMNTAEDTGADATKEREKDTRIQMLEKTLDREREYLRKEKEESKKEKANRIAHEKLLSDHMHLMLNERKKLEDEIKIHKQHIRSVLESTGLQASQLPSESGIEDQSISYFFSVEKFEEAVNTAIDEDTPSSQPHLDSLTREAAAGSSSQQVPISPPLSNIQGHFTEQKDRDAVKVTSDTRKMVRKIIRPRIEKSEEPVPGNDALETDKITMMEGKGTESLLEEPQIIAPSEPSSSSKRIAPSAVPPPSKKTKVEDSSIGSAESLSTQHVESSPAQLPADDGTEMPNDPVSKIAADSEKYEVDDGSMDIEEQANEAEDTTFHDHELRTDDDTLINSPSKSMETTDMLNEALQTDEMQEIYPQAVFGEEDREEGEMDPNEQPDDDGAQESTHGDVSIEDMLEEPAIIQDEEKNEDCNTTEQDSDGKPINDNDRTSADPGDSLQSAPESSLSHVDTVPSVSAQSSSVVPADTTETPATSTHIDLAERARANAQIRQAGLGLTSRALSRGGGRFNRNNGRGGRGPRGRGG